MFVSIFYYIMPEREIKKRILKLLNLYIIYINIVSILLTKKTIRAMKAEGELPPFSKTSLRKRLAVS